MLDGEQTVILDQNERSSLKYLKKGSVFCDYQQNRWNNQKKVSFVGRHDASDYSLGNQSINLMKYTLSYKLTLSFLFMQHRVVSLNSHLSKNIYVRAIYSYVNPSQSVVFRVVGITQLVNTADLPEFRQSNYVSSRHQYIIIVLVDTYRIRLYNNYHMIAWDAVTTSYHFAFFLAADNR